MDKAIKIPVIVLWIFLQGALFTASAQNYKEEIRVERFGVEEGLSQSGITAIYQDKYGYLWIGTEDGLNKYDGYQMAIYKKDEFDTTSLSGNIIRQIYEDSKGRLWVATNDGISLYSRETNTFRNFLESSTSSSGLSSSYCWTLCEGFDGKMYVGTNDGGLNIIDIESNKFFHSGNSDMEAVKKAFSQIIVIHKDDNFLYLGSSSGLQTIDRQGKIKTYTSGNSELPSDRIESFLQLSKDSLLTVTYGGLSVYVSSLDKFFPYHAVSHCKADKITSATIDTKGDVWIGTYTGLYHATGSACTQHRNYEYDFESISENHITKVFTDRSGVVWIGTRQKGLNKYDNQYQEFKHVHHELMMDSTLGSNYVYCFSSDSESDAFIGTASGLYQMASNGKIYLKKFNDSKVNFDKLTYSAIYKDRNNKILWLGTRSGLFAYQYIKDKVLPAESFINMPSGGVVSIISDKKNRLLVASGKLYVLDSGSKEFATREFDIAGTLAATKKAATIQVVYQDNAGNIWIGYRGSGLLKLDENFKILEHYMPSSDNVKGISDNIILSIYQDRNDDLWIGTKIGGLCKYDYKKNNFVNYREKDGLAGNMINGIIGDNRGILWISTNRGVSRFNPKTEETVNYNIHDGLQGNEFNTGAVFKSYDGKIFFGGNNGFNIFNPLNIIPNPHLPQVVITEFSYGKNHEEARTGNFVKDGDRIELDHMENAFNVQFSAMHFVHPTRNTFAYKLEGYDKDWSYTGSAKRYASYTNLEPGEYTFMVKAANNDNVWNEEPLKLHIIIQPPYWATWWFRSLVIMGFLIIGYAIYAYRINQIKGKELKKQVDEKTAELQSKNDELQFKQAELLEKNEEINQQNEEMLAINETLEAQKTEIQQQNKEIGLLYKEVQDSIRTALVLQESILPTDEEIKKYLPDSFVLFRPKDIVSGDFYWFEEKDEYFYFAAVDCTGHGVAGAFMSLIGNNLLQNILASSENPSPGEILDKLNIGVIKTLRQEEEGALSRDGMDVSLVKIKKDKSEVYYAGAVNYLYLIRDGQINKIKANPFSIGYPKYGKIRSFTTHKVEVQKDDVIYMYSDGFADQMGGPTGDQKFMYPAFREMLLNNHWNKFREQCKIYDQTINQWIGTGEQTDDILLIGFKI